MSWLTTKKLGRDDDEIERDRLRALEARKRKKPTKVMASPDSEINTGTSAAKVGRSKTANHKQRINEASSSSSSDEGNEPLGFLQSAAFPKRTSKPPPPVLQKRLTKKVKRQQSHSFDRFKKQSPYFATAKNMHTLVDTPEKSAGAVLARAQVHTPIVAVAAAAATDTAKETPGGACLVDSSDEDRPRTLIRPIAVPAKEVPNGESAIDEDDELALALALSQSLTETPKSLSEEQEAIVLDLQESSDADDDDSVDEDAQQAVSILATANNLSAQVLQTMQGWTDQAAQGMLVDQGALNLAHVHNPLPSHTWIAPKVFQRLLTNIELAMYQVVGVNWLALLHNMSCLVNGRPTNVNGVLADEMGLGKTIQTIAFLAWLKHSAASSVAAIENTAESDRVIDLSAKELISREHLPHLIVAPASVLSNWEREFAKFAPALNVVKYHGSQRERNELQEELRLHLPTRSRPAGLPPLDVILVPMSYFQKEKSDDRNFLKKFSYNYMVVDEAHMLKNAKGLRYVYLNRFDTAHRLLLTGTPVQNSPQELLALLCFLMPLFSRKGQNFEDGPSNDGGESMLQHFVSLEGGQEASDEVAFRKLKQLFAPFVLRRRKEDVLSQILPKKTRKLELLEMDTSGRQLYDSILINHLKAKEIGMAVSREHLFTQLRKAAHHPLLIRSRYTSTAEKEHIVKYFYEFGAFRGEGCSRAKVAEELERYNDFQIHLTALELVEEKPLKRKELGRYILDEDDLFSSAKFVHLRSLLPGLISDGHRILLFSSWTSCLDLLGCLLEQMGYRYMRMEGSTPVSERQDLIDDFTADETIPVFLLSTKACGLGINLTAADICIMHDLDFNPFNDLQAEDRCYRIGQKKPVTVYKLVTKDTVDEDIYRMQERKARMNAAIMESSGDDWTKEAGERKDAVLQSAMNRFLKSPDIARPEKEDISKENAHIMGDSELV